MRPGAPVFGTGLPLSVELGPGLLRSIFDGIQRPLPVIEMRTGSFISRGVHLTPLYRKGRWNFTPIAKWVMRSKAAPSLARSRNTHYRTPRDGSPIFPARSPGSHLKSFYDRRDDRKGENCPRRKRDLHVAALAHPQAAPPTRSASVPVPL